MLSEKEYQEMKRRDQEQANAIIEQIQKDPRPAVKYKDGRPITDIKNMIETSVEVFGRDHRAFYQKFKKGGSYESVTYGQMLDMVNGLGTLLIDARMKGKRIAVIGDNCSQWAISYLATVCGTGVIVPLDKELNSLELKQLVVQAEVNCVFFSERFQSTFEDMKNSDDTVIKMLVNLDAEENFREGDREIFSWKQMVESGMKLVANGDRRFIDAQILKDEMSILLFTSGTTGAAKGVMLSHWNIVTNTMVAVTIMRVEKEDVFFSVLPVHHTYECTCGFLMPLYKGATIAYCEGLKHIVSNLKEIQPTLFLGVPLLFESLYRKIWKNVRKQGKENLLRKVIALNKKTQKINIDLGKIFLKDIRAIFGGRMRMMICGGAAINPAILEGIQDFGVMAVQGYGLTECSPLGALNPDTAAKSEAIGTNLPGCELKIIDANEEGIGELCLKGENVMLGYYNMPEVTANVIKDGWLHTGDLGYIDQDGYAHLTGRKKNVIITKNGKNVYPEELEYHLGNISYVEESFVFGQDSDDGQDTLIVASIKLDEEEVAELLGKGYTDEEAKELLWKDVDKINTTMPFFKKIKKLILRKTDFQKSTSKKIIRYLESNREEQ